MHLHSHVVWNRWGLASQLQSRLQLGNQMESHGSIYHLDLPADVAKLVECLMEYCYTGDVYKLECLTRLQVERIGMMKETTIYSTAALIPDQQVELDSVLMNWRQQYLHPIIQPIIQPTEPNKQAPKDETCMIS